MKIYLITPIYPCKTGPSGQTAVVHYFAKEWVRQGHDIHVFHLNAKWPGIYYFIFNICHKFLSSLFGFIVPIKMPAEYNENYDGVKILHWTIKKLFPHKLPSKKELNIACKRILLYCNQNGYPDCFVGHWDNPQIEILDYLKKKTSVLTAIVLHNNVFNLEQVHGKNVKQKLESFDLIGFRCITARENYISKYGAPKQTFLAYSGVSDIFLKQRPIKKFEVSSNKYVFVGSLIKRKFPKEILLALNDVYPDGNFELTYIGDGREAADIRKCRTRGRIIFTGRIKREKIIRYLLDADCFIMVSKDEIFGLVYLEAMACGCITIGSRNEGIDGIIVDSYNGFLCEAGNISELSHIITRIRNLTPTERQKIINNSINTAYRFTDAKVASDYIQSLKHLLGHIGRSVLP